MGVLQPWHLIIILLIVLVIFGPGKLSNLGGSLGKTIKDFRQSLHDTSDKPSTDEGSEESKGKES